MAGKRIGAIFCLALLMPAQAALAQDTRANPIPDEILALEAKNCTKSCGSSGVEAALCEAYCDCAVAGLKKRMTFDTYTRQAAERAATGRTGAAERLLSQGVVQQCIQLLMPEAPANPADAKEPPAPPKP